MNMDNANTQDWLQGSVIINNDGTPTSLYHATDKEIIGNLTPSLYGTYGSGIYLGDRVGNVEGIFGNNVISACARITNPWRVKADPDSEGAFAEDFDHPSVEAILALPGGRNILEKARRNGWLDFGPELTAILRQQGYDGIIATWDDDFREIVAFDEHQVRILPLAGLQVNDPGAMDYYNTPGARETAHALKKGDINAIELASEHMARRVSEGDTLVPVPNHNGQAVTTLALSQAIAEKSGATVVDVLKGKNRVSSYATKARGIPVSQEDLTLWLVGDAPAGRVFLVDNIIATGATMRAALDHIPYASPLVFAQDRSPSNLDIRFKEVESMNLDDEVGITGTLEPIHTPAFKERFGKSKVVDNQGKPLVVYHGTYLDFDTFKPSEDGDLGAGIYFSKDPDEASLYAGIEPSDSGGRVIPVYLRLENPISEDDAATLEMELGGEGAAAEIKSRGHDGIIGHDTIVVYDDSQIQSAISNHGTFDHSNPDIRFSIGDGGVDGSFSTQANQGNNPAINSINAEMSQQYTVAPELRDFIGDSKVVDSRGRPLVVYHGTSRDFNTFTEDQYGIFFTPDAERAETFSRIRKGSPNIMPVYLSISNPWQLIEYGPDVPYMLQVDQSKEALTKQGYDGIYMAATELAPESWVAFYPNQIKSATGNVGTYNKHTSDIRYSLNETSIDGSFNDVFYSGLTRAVERLTQERGTARQFLNAIRKQPGVKSEELEWTGLEEYLGALESQGGRVTKAGILSYLKSNGVRVEEIMLGWGSTEYDDHQLPGGTNYREVLLTLPVDTDAINDFANNSGLSYRSAAQILQFRAGHWDQTDASNVIAHVRLNDRIDDQGRKHLFIEEIQSDWHQLGRKRGYAKDISELTHVYTPEDFEIRQSADHWITEDFEGISRYIGKRTASTEEAAREHFANWLTSLSYLYSIDSEDGRKAPDAPFKGNAWAELAIKRVLSLAAEGEYDAIAWTTGDQQVERYELSMHLSKIEYRRYDDAPDYYDFHGFDQHDNLIVEKECVSIDTIASLAGKDITKRIKSLEGTLVVSDTYCDMLSLTGDDLVVGGNGMRGFYDGTLPNLVKKTARKLDRLSNIESATITVDGDQRLHVQTLPVSHILKQSANAGQPLFRLSDSTWHNRADDFSERVGKMAVDLRDRFSALKLPESIALKVVDTIKDENQHQDVAGNGGLGIIKIALSSSDPIRTLNHESIHALRSLGLFEANEWSALEREAKRYHRREQIEQFYESNHLSDEQMTEEVIAEMYADWSSSEKQTFTVTIRDAFARIRDVIGAIGSALRGNGFTTADSILRRVERGEVGNRFYTSPYNDGSAFRQDKISLDEIDLSNIDIGPDEVESHSISKN